MSNNVKNNPAITAENAEGAAEAAAIELTHTDGENPYRPQRTTTRAFIRTRSRSRSSMRARPTRN